ncbi:MAG TPA: hypothetical protein DCG10_06445 [Lachnospiraceae bacterium]|nr:hypothetical protein [Lachnospiraceae bacterium]
MRSSEQQQDPCYQRYCCSLIARQTKRISPLGLILFCVYDEPSTDLCLHKNLYLANVHHRAFKRDGVQSIQIE